LKTETQLYSKPLFNLKKAILYFVSLPLLCRTWTKPFKSWL